MRCLQGEGLPLVTFEQSRSFVGRGARVFVERMERAVTGGNTRRAAPTICTRASCISTSARMRIRASIPAWWTCCRGCAPMASRLGLCTNKPMGPTRAVLAHLGWDGFFDVVIGGDSLPVAKPDPAPLMAVVEGWV